MAEPNLLQRAETWWKDKKRALKRKPAIGLADFVLTQKVGPDYPKVFGQGVLASAVLGAGYLAFLKSGEAQLQRTYRSLPLLRSTNLPDDPYIALDNEPVWRQTLLQMHETANDLFPEAFQDLSAWIVYLVSLRQQVTLCDPTTIPLHVVDLANEAYARAFDNLLILEYQLFAWAGSTTDLESRDPRVVGPLLQSQMAIFSNDDISASNPEVFEQLKETPQIFDALVLSRYRTFTYHYSTIREKLDTERENIQRYIQLLIANRTPLAESTLARFPESPVPEPQAFAPGARFPESTGSQAFGSQAFGIPGSEYSQRSFHRTTLAASMV